MITSRIFIVLVLTFKPLIHFEFIFICGVIKASTLILLYVTVQFSQYHWLKRVSFLSSVLLCLLLCQYHTSFSLLAVAGTSSTMLIKSWENGHPCVVPDLRGDTFRFSPLRMMGPSPIGALLHSGMSPLYSLFFLWYTFF